jgi:prepilin-type N-terminal cleavage/methylation domain-containing protein
MKTRDSGMTMIEVMMALAVISIAIMGVMSAMSSISVLVDANHDELTALNIARQKLSEIQSTPFSTVFNQFGPNQSARYFTVSALQQGTGQIIFPVNSSGGLDETVVDPYFGMPMDLNGNGAADTNVSGSYTILPIRIYIQWNSTTGMRELKLNTLLSKLK